MKSSFVRFERPYFAPGLERRALRRLRRAPSRSEKFMPYFASTHTVITSAPPMSRIALMICT